MIPRSWPLNNFYIFIFYQSFWISSMFELSYRVTNDLAQISNKPPSAWTGITSPCYALSPVRPPPTIVFFPMAALSQEAYLVWPSCFSCPLISFLSLLPLEEFLLHEVLLCLWCTHWWGQLHLHLSVRKTLNSTFSFEINISKLNPCSELRQTMKWW